MEDDLATTFLEIKTTHGHSISITRDNMLNGGVRTNTSPRAGHAGKSSKWEECRNNAPNYIPQVAWSVRPGDFLLSGDDGMVEVETIDEEVLEGVYNPITAAHTIPKLR